MTIEVKGFIEEFIPVWRKLVEVDDAEADLEMSVELKVEAKEEWEAALKALTDEHDYLSRQGKAIIEKYFGSQKTMKTRTYRLR